MSRIDISPFLVHFTGGDNLEDAFRNFQTIIAEQRLLGTGNRIRGGYHCVCFSEAPISSLTRGLVNERYYSRYSPFGILVAKEWIFTRGGRPVIYQTEEEYTSLPEDLRWRHMRYDIRGGFERVDFTWEREWRIPIDSLEFDNVVASLVVLDTSWAHRLVLEHEKEEGYRVLQYSAIFDAGLAEAYREPFKWRVLTLR